MKQIALTTANRINLTLALAEVLEGVEFTKKQFEDARQHLAHLSSNSARNPLYLPNHHKAFSLSNLCEEGYIKLVRQETFTREVECFVYAVIHRDDLAKDTDEWTPLFKGSCYDCDRYRWDEMVGKDARQHTTVFYETALQPIEMKRNFYTFDREALEAMVAKMVEKIYE